MEENEEQEEEKVVMVKEKEHEQIGTVKNAEQEVSKQRRTHREADIADIGGISAIRSYQEPYGGDLYKYKMAIT